MDLWFLLPIHDMTNVDVCPYVVAHNCVYKKNTPLINIRFFFLCMDFSEHNLIEIKLMLFLKIFFYIF
jgi:hypothetical protein